jgi:hypothetical protein
MEAERQTRLLTPKQIDEQMRVRAECPAIPALVAAYIYAGLGREEALGGRLGRCAALIPRERGRAMRTRYLRAPGAAAGPGAWVNRYTQPMSRM